MRAIIFLMDYPLIYLCKSVTIHLTEEWAERKDSTTEYN